MLSEVKRLYFEDYLLSWPPHAACQMDQVERNVCLGTLEQLRLFTTRHVGRNRVEEAEKKPLTFLCKILELCPGAAAKPGKL